MMVKDHSDANGKLKDLAEAARIPLPEQLDAEHAIVRDRLQKLDGDAFDSAYIKSQIVDHQKTAQLLAWQISMGETRICSGLPQLFFRMCSTISAWRRSLTRC
jgi:putative membrane protein